MDRKEERGVGTGNPTMDRQEAPRDAGAEQRIEQRRENEKRIDELEEEGWGQPESSAQKEPDKGARP